MNYQWCEGCANYLGALGCALGNEEIFEGDDYAMQHCPDRQELEKTDDEADEEA